ELLFGVRGRDGYVRTDDPALADVLLVNTCAVRDHAEQKVLSRLGELKVYKRRDTVLGVVGCMAQRLGLRLLERVPQVDLVIGPDGYGGRPELIARARGGERAAQGAITSWERDRAVPPPRDRERGGRRPGGSAALAVHVALSHRLHRARAHRPGRDASGVRARAPAGAKRQLARAQADAAALRPRALSRRRRRAAPRAARDRPHDRHHRRLPGRAGA